MTAEEEKRRALELSSRQIGTIGRLGPRMWQLEKLYLSHNALRSLEGIEALPQLQVLSLAHNHLADWQELAKVRSKNKLRFLGVHGNPLCLHPDFRRKLVQLFPGLEVLDDLKVTALLRLADERVYQALSRKLLPFLLLLQADCAGQQLPGVEFPPASREAVRDRLSFAYEIGCKLR